MVDCNLHRKKNINKKNATCESDIYLISTAQLLVQIINSYPRRHFHIDG